MQVEHVHCFFKDDVRVSFEPIILLLRIYPAEILAQKYTGMLFIAALYATMKNW